MENLWGAEELREFRGQEWGKFEMLTEICLENMTEKNILGRHRQ
jgi:hypothetical protein